MREEKRKEKEEEEGFGVKKFSDFSNGSIATDP